MTCNKFILHKNKVKSRSQNPQGSHKHTFQSEDTFKFSSESSLRFVSRPIDTKVLLCTPCTRLILRLFKHPRGHIAAVVIIVANLYNSSSLSGQ